MTDLTPRQVEIMRYICEYAGDKDGPTPSINEIAHTLEIAYSTAYYHIRSLRLANRLRVVDGKLCVIGSEWYPPPEVILLD